MSEQSTSQSPERNQLTQLLELQGYAEERLRPNFEEPYVVTDTRHVARIAWDHDVQEQLFVADGFNVLSDHFYSFHRQEADKLCPCPLDGSSGPGLSPEFTPQSLIEFATRLKASPDELADYNLSVDDAQNAAKIAELLDYAADLDRRRREYDEREAIRLEISEEPDFETKKAIIRQKAVEHFDPELLIREIEGAKDAKRAELGENTETVVRAMRPGDVLTLGNVLRIHPGFREAYAQRIKDGKMKMFVAYLDDRPVARGTLLYEGPTVTEEDPDEVTEKDVVRLFRGPVPWAYDGWTCEGYRGRGLIPAITLARIDEARQLGSSVIAMGIAPDNVFSLKANERLNFKRVKKGNKDFQFLAHREDGEPGVNLLLKYDLSKNKTE